MGGKVMRTLKCATAALLLLAGSADTIVAGGTSSADDIQDHASANTTTTSTAKSTTTTTATTTDNGIASVNDLIRRSESDVFNTGVMAGIYIGMSWANDMLMRGRKEQPLFCQPDADANNMTPQQLRSILGRYIAAHPESGRLRSDYLGFILLSALTEKFPCEH
jgi:hypothetical protein